MAERGLVAVRLGDEQAEWLRERAAAQGRTPAELIRQWVAEKMADERRGGPKRYAGGAARPSGIVQAPGESEGGK